VVVSNWENALDKERLHQQLDLGSDAEFEPARQLA
jgi:hypothetical protein